MFSKSGSWATKITESCPGGNHAAVCVGKDYLYQPAVKESNSPLGLREAEGGLMFCLRFLFIYFFTISVRPIISTSTRPIFTKLVGLVELRLQINDLKLVFRSLRGRCRGNRFLLVLSTSIHR